ncbi:restriction alleviation protein, Lar family [Rhizobium laguerreae]|nr:restriction alleviation protein, Lar family [Rhizobium laguerreae]
MTASPIRLVACPFCGGEDKLRLADNADPSSMTHWVTCDKKGCECDGPWRKSPEAAVEAWNTRTGVHSHG